MRKFVPILLLPAACLLIANTASAQKKADETPKDSVARTIGLEEVKVLASFGNPEGKEPVVLSTIGSARIRERLGNQEFPEILKSVPSVYTSKQGGGFGDSRMTLRGFGSENIALLINGVPVNGMENGSVYWSNWAGMADVASGIQVQRGIGLSKLGLFSVGGTVNIITESTYQDRQASVFYGIGNDNYQKLGISVSTGLLPKGWAFTFAGTRTTGDGYVYGTNFEAWTWFGSLSKKIGKRHLLSLTGFGAPQWHNRRSNRQSIEDYRTNRDGIRMNTSFGYINGQLTPTYSGYNEYHKPLISLNHYWTINEKSNLSTSVYISNASGGGRKVYGSQANRLQYNYKNGQPYPGVTELTPEGYINYLPVMEDNRNSATGSQAIFTMGTNSHQWYGFLSSYSNQLNDKFKVTAGLDGRYYVGYHYDEIEDLLGGLYFKDNKLAWRDPDLELHKGDKVNQDYTSRILWMSAFAQAEYSTEHIKSFLSVSIADHSYKREDPGKYGPYGDQSKYPAGDKKTSWRNFVPVSVKAGVNYIITPVHSVFVNGGFVTRPPMMDNIYTDNTPLRDPVNEQIGTVEAGYFLNLGKLSATINGYYTKWMNKSVTKFIGNTRACIPNIDARHMGIELDVWYRPVPELEINGFYSLGNWRWTKNVDFALYDDQNNLSGEYHAYIKDLHVGNAPQTSLMLNATYEPMPRLKIGAQWNYYGRYYADFAPADRTNPDNTADAWKLPNFGLVDLHFSYGMRTGFLNATIFANVNNVFNRKYISDALNGADNNAATAMVWYGFGTTWNVGLRLQF